MKKEFNVVSLFDGMSCLQIALNRNGIKPTKYYASEVDKHAMKVTMANFTDTIQIGDVRNVKGSDLGFVHLLGGGSPCQSFSFAGKRNGMSTTDSIEILTLDHYLELKSQNFEFEGQSYLFWEYIRIYKELNEVNPDILFLLENVMMGEKWQKILTRAIGINPIQINSALLSAQNRNRLYWTNIFAEPDGLFGDLKCNIPQPKDKGILLKDVLEKEVDEKYFLSDKMLSFLHTRNKETIDINGKSSCFTAGGNSGCLHSQMDLICVAMRGRNPENPKSRASGLPTEQQIEPRTDGKTNCLTSVQKDNLVMQLNPSKESGGKQPYQQNRVYDSEGISPALCAHKADLLIMGCDYRKDEGLRIRENGKSGTLAARARNDESCGQLAIINKTIRRLTPIECERLQTVPDNYTNFVSDTQRYKMLGNGWTVDVISHILSFIPAHQTRTKN